MFLGNLLLVGGVLGYAVRNQTTGSVRPGHGVVYNGTSRGWMGLGKGRPGVSSPMGTTTSAVEPSSTIATPSKITPKIIIISLFPSEANIWYDMWPTTSLGNLSATTYTTAGTCMLYPALQCTQDHSVCQITTGMGEINAATTTMALLLSPMFDFSSTYFLVAGIGGVNPHRGTLGSVALAEYAVQVALQYELDSREIPQTWDTGYVAYGTKEPLQYPQTLYGTEVFHLNNALQSAAFGLASKGNLSDDDAAEAYREKYIGMDGVEAGLARPSVLKCDVATSDVYFSGNLLAGAFEETVKVWTNGSGEYCMTASEDNAVLEVLVRMAIEGIADFGRVMVMRAGSNFDRPPAGTSAYEHLFVLDQNGFNIAISNLFNAGIEIVRGILTDWECTYASGLTPTSYMGDIWGSLGGSPDFGPGSITGGKKIEKAGGTGTLVRRGSVEGEVVRKYRLKRGL